MIRFYKIKALKLPLNWQNLQTVKLLLLVLVILECQLFWVTNKKFSKKLGNKKIFFESLQHKLLQ